MSRFEQFFIEKARGFFGAELLAIDAKCGCRRIAAYWSVAEFTRIEPGIDSDLVLRAAEWLNGQSKKSVYVRVFLKAILEEI